MAHKGWGKSRRRPYPAPPWATPPAWQLIWQIQLPERSLQLSSTWGHGMEFRLDQLPGDVSLPLLVAGPGVFHA